MLEKTIDGLFVATGYLVWLLGVIGLVGSVILGFVNLSMGIPAVMLFVATFLVSIAASVALMPKAIIDKGILPTVLTEKKVVITVVALIAATAIAGIVYFTNGGFPELNLIFM